MTGRETPYRKADEPEVGTYPLRVGREWTLPLLLVGVSALLTILTRGRWLCFVLVLPFLGLASLRGYRLVRVYPSRIELFPLLGRRRVLPTRDLHVASTGSGLALHAGNRTEHLPRARFYTEEAFRHFCAAVQRVARPD